MPEIKNRCTKVHGMSPMDAAIAKLTPSNQESLHVRGLKCAKTCCDSQIHPLKSRITAVPSCRQVEWPACSKSCRYDAASDSNYRRLKEQFAHSLRSFAGSLPARRGGPCKTVVYQGVARLGEPLFRFGGAGFVKASFQRPGPQNEISIAFAMLTP